MAKGQKGGNWQREDKLLDYIAGHKEEILRYLIVVLVGEVLRWGIGVGCAFLPALLPFQGGLTFLLWGLPYFIACKLWVWEQRGENGYIWATQGLKFLMVIFAVALITNLLRPLFDSLGDLLAALLINLIWEALYFLAMFKLVLKPKK